MIQSNIVPAVYKTPLVIPSKANPLPGIRTILARPAPGGVTPPLPIEALTGIKKVEYRDLYPTEIPATPNPLNPPVQAFDYATNPRKDATTPKLESAVVAFNKLAFAAANASNAKNQIIVNNDLVTNDTGKHPTIRSTIAPTVVSPVVVPETTEIAGESPSGALHWAALLVLAGIAFFTLKR